MGKITFVVGGTRSGKSRFATQQASTKNKRVAFIATCQPLDEEMKKRISLHQKTRPSRWQVFEEPRNVSRLLHGIDNAFEIIVIDCLTLLVSNMMLEGTKEPEIEKEIRGIVSILKRIKAKSIIVSNEVGLGIVPGNKLARDFRDIAGRANQIVACDSDSVYFLVSGIPMKIK